MARFCKLKAKQAFRRLKMEEDFDVFAFAGQSNADEHFFRRDGDTSVPLGREVFQQEILDQTGFQTDVLNVSGPGSASNNNVVTPFYNRH